MKHFNLLATVIIVVSVAGCASIVPNRTKYYDYNEYYNYKDSRIQADIKASYIAEADKGVLNLHIKGALKYPPPSMKIVKETYAYPYDSGQDVEELILCPVATLGLLAGEWSWLWWFVPGKIDVELKKNTQNFEAALVQRIKTIDNFDPNEVALCSKNSVGFENIDLSFFINSDCVQKIDLNGGNIYYNNGVPKACNLDLNLNLDITKWIELAIEKGESKITLLLRVQYTDSFQGPTEIDLPLLDLTKEKARREAVSKREEEAAKQAAIEATIEAEWKKRAAEAKARGNAKAEAERIKQEETDRIAKQKALEETKKIAQTVIARCKEEAESKSQLCIKGFYIGMSPKDAETLMTYYSKKEQKCERNEKKQVKEMSPEELENEINRSYLSWRAIADDQDRVWFIALDINTLYNAESYSAQEFVQSFLNNNRQVSVMEGCKGCWYYKNHEVGYEFRITNDKKILLEKIQTRDPLEFDQGQKFSGFDKKYTVDLGSGVAMDFMPIKAGSFYMGSNNGDSDEKPVHRVTLTQPFWMGRTEVTQAQYQRIMGDNPSKFKGNDNPVECVSWSDAVEFCKKLTERESIADRLPDGYEYRLPTEAEWECCCRAGTTGDYAGYLDSMAWHLWNSDCKTHCVGTKSANDWGLYDMHGNVWEWCYDRYGDYSSSSASNPKGAGSGADRVLRGGSCGDGDSCGSAIRGRNTPESSGFILGFRVARAPQLKNDKSENTETEALAVKKKAELFEIVEKTGDPDVITKLVESGADVNARNEYNVTPLMIASCYNSNVDIIKHLIKLGADIKAANNDGWTPIIYAAENRNPDIVEFLIKSGANINDKDKSGNSVLSRTVTHNKNLNVANRLIKLGADVNTRNSMDSTALMWAAGNENTNITHTIELLVEHGADMTARDQKGRTAWDYISVNPRLRGTPVYWMLHDAYHNITPSSYERQRQKKIAGLDSEAGLKAEAELTEGEKWIADLGGGVIMEFVPIPAGSFLMGLENDPDQDWRTAPRHHVTLTQPFWMAKTEVSQAQYQQVMENNPSQYKRESLPVECVTWNDAMEFCRKLTEKEHKSGRLPEKFIYTLPTEAQWEYACRAGSTGDYAGDPDAMAWTDKNSGNPNRPKTLSRIDLSNRPHAVGTKQSNAWGLYDMHGNISEWCLDMFDEKYYIKSPAIDPLNSNEKLSDPQRALRGGSFALAVIFCKSASREGSSPTSSYGAGGFRPIVIQH